MKLQLEEHERHSAVWQKVKEAATAELEALRKKNDSTLMDPVQTAVVRGRIASMKDLLSAGEGVKPVEPSL